MLALASKCHYSVPKGLILTFDLQTAPKIKNRGVSIMAGQLQKLCEACAGILHYGIPCDLLADSLLTPRILQFLILLIDYNSS